MQFEVSDYLYTHNYITIVLEASIIF